MRSKDNLGAYAVVMKLSVSNLQNSVKWYEENLGFVPEPRFNTPTWAQLHVPGVDQFSIGLEEVANPVNSGGESTSFAVRDIEKTREELIKKGIEIQPVIGPIHGDKLAFFNDPDGNVLSLRQPIHQGKHLRNC